MRAEAPRQSNWCARQFAPAANLGAALPAGQSARVAGSFATPKTSRLCQWGSADTGVAFGVPAAPEKTANSGGKSN